jgi:hypothetical protein
MALLVAPSAIGPVSKLAGAPEALVAVWGMPEVLCHWIGVPLATVTAAGEKAPGVLAVVISMVTAAGVGCGVGAEPDGGRVQALMGRAKRSRPPMTNNAENLANPVRGISSLLCAA